MRGRIAWAMKWKDNPTVGEVLAYGNFPRIDQPEYQDFPEPKNGCYPFRGYDVSTGQDVTFDDAQGNFAKYATNIVVVAPPPRTIVGSMNGIPRVPWWM